jgi:hypothetical protein
VSSESPPESARLPAGQATEPALGLLAGEAKVAAAIVASEELEQTAKNLFPDTDPVATVRHPVATSPDWVADTVPELSTGEVS